MDLQVVVDTFCCVGGVVVGLRVIGGWYTSLMVSVPIIMRMTLSKVVPPFVGYIVGLCLCTFGSKMET